MKTHRIFLVEVDTETEERDVVHRLGISRTRAGDAVVPVQRSGLVANKICRIAEACRYEVLRKPYSWSFEFLTGHRAATGPVDDCGLAIVPVGDFDLSFISLARSLSGGSVIAPTEIKHADNGRFRSALVVHDGNSTNILCQTIAHLSHREIPFGLVVVDDSSDGYLALIKALLFPVVEINDVDWPENLKFGSASSDGPNSREVSDPDRTAIQAGQRLLVLNGHGNAIDLGKAGAVICARGTGNNLPQRVYPCFRDGLCFRQPIFGRSPASSAGLIDPAEFGHPIVLLLGCGTMPLGNSPFQIGGTILGRMARSHALGGVATLGVLYHDFNVEMLLVALLLDGYSLGDVVRLANTWHRKSFGNTSPAPEGYGPMIAFGHPNLRVDSGLIKTLTYSEAVKDCLRIPSDHIPLSDNGLALLKVTEVPKVPAAVEWFRGIDPSRRSAVRISTESSGAGVLFLSYLLANESHKVDSGVTHSANHERRHEEVAALRDSLNSFPYCRLLLGQIARRLSSERNSTHDDIEEAFRLLDQTELSCLRYLSITSLAAEGEGSGEYIAETHSSVFALSGDWQRCMLSIVSRYVRDTGGFTFHLWQDLYHRERDSRALYRCPSCTRDSAAISFSSYVNPSDAHELIHCPVCGVIGEIPASIGVNVTITRPETRGSRNISITVDLDNYRVNPIVASITLMRECWFHRSPDLAEVTECRIGRGGRAIVPIRLALSQRLTEGVYPFTLIAIVNGGLVHLRIHCQIFEQSDSLFVVQGG